MNASLGKDKTLDLKFELLATRYHCQDRNKGGCWI